MPSKDSIIFSALLVAFLVVAAFFITIVLPAALSAITIVPPGIEFEDEFTEATNKTGGLNFILVKHEDLSVTLYAWNNDDTTKVGADGLPDKMTPLKGYANEQALTGPNGVKDVLAKVPLWRNLTNLTQ